MGLQGLETGWTALGITLLLLAMVLALKARQWRDRAGLPQGDVIYTDMGNWYPQRQPLFSAELGLTGRPDYLVQNHEGSVIPVEIKSGNAPSEPYYNHVLQLAAYCALVEAEYGTRPDHGIIQYQDAAFAVEYSRELESDLLSALAAMSSDLYADDVPRSHQNWRLCAGCAHRSHCGQQLV